MVERRKATVSQTNPVRIFFIDPAGGIGLQCGVFRVVFYDIDFNARDI